MKRDRYFAVKFTEAHGDIEESLFRLFHLTCEDFEAEQFLDEMIDGTMSDWYGDGTYRDGDSFCKSDDSYFVYLKNKKEILESTFDDLKGFMYTEIYDIDEVRKARLME
jgi:hypothetical protein